MISAYDASLTPELNEHRSYKLRSELMYSAYRFATLSGTDKKTGKPQSFFYVWDLYDRHELKADLLRWGLRFNQALVMFQSVDGAYQMISCADGTEVSLGQSDFGVLNGHFYKEVYGRPFVLNELTGAVFDLPPPTQMRSVKHIAELSLDEYLQKHTS